MVVSLGNHLSIRDRRWHSLGKAITPLARGPLQKATAPSKEEGHSTRSGVLVSALVQSLSKFGLAWSMNLHDFSKYQKPGIRRPVTGRGPFAGKARGFYLRCCTRFQRVTPDDFHVH